MPDDSESSLDFSLLDDTGRVAVDLNCTNCGYNLRTLGRLARCPECGAAVLGSVEDASDFDPWTGSPDFHEGTLLAMVGSAAVAGGFLLVLVLGLTGAPRSESLITLLVAVCVALFLGGALLCLSGVGSVIQPFAESKCSETGKAAMHVRRTVRAPLIAFLWIPILFIFPLRTDSLQLAAFSVPFALTCVPVLTPYFLVRFLGRVAGRTGQPEVGHIARIVARVLLGLALPMLTVLVWAFVRLIGDVTVTWALWAICFLGALLAGTTSAFVWWVRRAYSTD